MSPFRSRKVDKDIQALPGTKESSVGYVHLRGKSMGTTKSKIGFISKLFIAIVMLASVYGCGGGSSSPTTGTLRIINNSGITVTQAFVSPSSSSTWGADQLSPDLPSGSSRDIGGVACSGTFDFWATNSPGTTQWGPGYGYSMPCGGIFPMTLN